jgi:hypothetical protein
MFSARSVVAALLLPPPSPCLDGYTLAQRDVYTRVFAQTGVELFGGAPCQIRLVAGNGRVGTIDMNSFLVAQFHDHLVRETDLLHHRLNQVIAVRQSLAHVQREVHLRIRWQGYHAIPIHRLNTNPPSTSSDGVSRERCFRMMA